MRMIYRVEGELLRDRRSLRIDAESPRRELRPSTRGLTVQVEPMLDRQTIHIHDLAAEHRRRISRRSRRAASGLRTTFLARRCCAKESPSERSRFADTEVRPFTEKQIELARNLRRPSRDRHRERAAVQRTAGAQRELREALEHQTATAEVLGIISRSPTDVQPVLDAIVESAARVCGIDDVRAATPRGERYGFAGSFWSHAHRYRVEISIDAATVSLDARAWHASHSRCPRAERFSKVGCPRQRLAHLLGRSPSSAGRNSLED